MRIKTKRLKQKLRPIFDDPSKELLQQRILKREYNRRCVWRYNVIMLCDNRAEFFHDYKMQEFSNVIFPSRRLFPQMVSRWFYMFQNTEPLFHLIRHGKHKLRVVKYKPKKEKAADISVDADNVKCGDIIHHSIDNTLVQVHHIDEAGLVHFIAFVNKDGTTAEHVEMQRGTYRCNYDHINNYRQATVKEKTWFRKWIKKHKRKEGKV